MRTDLSITGLEFLSPDPTTKEQHVDIMGLQVFLAIGAVAGWLAGTLMKEGGFGLLGNIAGGIIGAVIGGTTRRWEYPLNLGWPGIKGLMPASISF